MIMAKKTEIDNLRKDVESVEDEEYLAVFEMRDSPRSPRRELAKSKVQTSPILAGKESSKNLAKNNTNTTKIEERKGDIELKKGDGNDFLNFEAVDFGCVSYLSRGWKSVPTPLPQDGNVSVKVGQRGFRDNIRLITPKKWRSLASLRDDDPKQLEKRWKSLSSFRFTEYTGKWQKATKFDRQLRRAASAPCFFAGNDVDETPTKSNISPTDMNSKSSDVDEANTRLLTPTCGGVRRVAVTTMTPVTDETGASKLYWNGAIDPLTDEAEVPAGYTSLYEKWSRMQGRKSFDRDSENVTLEVQRL